MVSLAIVFRHLHNPTQFALAMSVPGIAAFTLIWAFASLSVPVGLRGWIAFLVGLSLYLGVYGLAAFLAFFGCRLVDAAIWFNHEGPAVLRWHSRRLGPSTGRLQDNSATVREVLSCGVGRSGPLCLVASPATLG